MHLTIKDPGIGEHVFLCEVLETALAVDRLNLPDLQAFEMVVRRLQLWEEIYSDALRRSEAAGGYGTDADERSIFLGLSLGLCSALVSPSLSEFVSSRLKEKSGMLKERRKAREERESLHGPGDDDDGRPAGGGGRRNRNPKTKPKPKPE